MAKFRAADRHLRRCGDRHFLDRNGRFWIFYLLQAPVTAVTDGVFIPRHTARIPHGMRHMGRLPLQASNDLQDALRNIATVQQFSAGTSLFTQGEHAKGIFLIESGSVVLMLCHHRTGKALFERTMRKGSLLGLPATMSDSPYSLSAKAVSEVRVSFVFRHELFTEMARNMTLTTEVLKVLSHEVHDIRDMIRISASKSTRRKTAAKSASSGAQ